jgi:hypothetical protein
MEFKCQSLKESLVRHFARATAVSQMGDACVATLPIPTVDGRVVDVFVETTLGDYFVVHDDGKAVDELVLQGVKITQSVADHFAAIARRFKVSYVDETFRSTVRSDDLQAAILAVGTCSSLAIGQLVGQIAVLPEEPIREQFGHALKSWARQRLKVQREVAVTGRKTRHKFDFVASPKTGRSRPIAVSVLLPGSNSKGAAERFGFIATDLDATPFEKWPWRLKQDLNCGVLRQETF